MRYVVLAADFDGTIARDGRVAPPTVAALERLAATGRKLILVTGRELGELLTLFPQISVFDRVVAENGAVLFCPGTGKRKDLGDAPPAPFVRELERRGVTPLAVGKSIVATVHPNETTVLEAIRDLGLELQVIFNKGAVMVLPASVNKASGLKAALGDLGLSARNTVAIGDAENDHALLREAEYGVAVANAVPMLQREADRASALAAGDAVIELIDDLIAHDLAKTPPRALRRRVAIGTRADGVEVHLPATSLGVLIAGPPGSGKSPLAAGLLARIVAEGYQICVIDPEGRYQRFADAIVFGTVERPPTADEVMTALEQPEASAIVSLIGARREDRSALFLELLPRLTALRASTGRPHWILVDEADQLLPRERDSVDVLVARDTHEMIYVTARPEAVSPQVLQAVDVAVALGDEAAATIARFATAAGAATPPADRSRAAPGEALLWLKSAGETPFAIALPEREEVA